MAGQREARCCHRASTLQHQGGVAFDAQAFVCGEGAYHRLKKDILRCGNISQHISEGTTDAYSETLCTPVSKAEAEAKLSSEVLRLQVGAQIEKASADGQRRMCESALLVCGRTASRAFLQRAPRTYLPDVAKDVAQVREHFTADGFASSCCLMASLQKPGAE